MNLSAQQRRAAVLIDDQHELLEAIAHLRSNIAEHGRRETRQITLAQAARSLRTQSTNPQIDASLHPGLLAAARGLDHAVTMLTERQREALT